LRPYQQIPILESGEALQLLPEDLARTLPHAYVELGAPYGDYSPFCLRRGVVARLLTAQAALSQQQPGWRLQIFDGYRPVAVQQFMVEWTFREQQTTCPDLSEAALWERVYQFWAPPSGNPMTPPPHSTGGAVDLTLMDEGGQPLDMGSPIDEVSPRSLPDYFADQPEGAAFAARRQLLYEIMANAGFAQHPGEWWHFCYGDQMWAWLKGQAQAHYGGV